MSVPIKRIGASLALGIVAAVLLFLPAAPDPSAAASLPPRAPAGSCGAVSCTYYLPLAAYAPIPAQLEVTQGIQQPSNSVMLIADRPTYVRMTLTSTTEYAGVSAWLYGSRNGSALPGSPLAALNNPRTLKATVNRAALGDTFNFELPASWTSGTVELWTSASNGAGYSYASGSASFQFTVADPMNVTVVPIAYTCTSGGSGTHTPTPPYDYVIDYTFRTYPVPDINLSTATVPIAHNGPCIGSVPDPQYDDWTKLLQQVTLRWYAAGWPDNYYYGLLDVYCQYGCIAGIGWVTGGDKAAVGFTGFGLQHYAASETHAHEVGHNHGRYHAPGCSAANPDPGFPYASYVEGELRGFIGNAAHPNYGFDIDTLAIYPYAAYYDFMSYCEPTWVSDYTYEALWAYDAAYRASPPEALGERALLIAGELTADGVVFRPAYLLDAPATLPEPGDYTLELLDGAGRLIATYPFAPITAVADTYPPGPGPEHQAFFLSLPPVPDVEAVRVRQGEAILGLLQPGRRSPALLAESALLHGDTLHWQASDPDGDALHYWVRLSADGGETWETVGIDLTTPSLALDAGLGRGADLLVEIIASDGLHATTLRANLSR